ncbi:MAG: amidohydrolase family protein [Deltaproteobacteria bacterium]|nr:amidohydrolase family protein [Deltaproteobacteria bacterium]
MRTSALAVGLLAVLAACAGSPARKPVVVAPPAPDKAPEIDLESTWSDPEALVPQPRKVTQGARLPARAVLIRHATILTAAGKRLDDGAILLEDGRITALGADGTLAPPEGALVVDATGKFVTPGIIDAHSHIGVYPAPATAATSDGNEATDPNTAGVAAEYAYTAQDPAIARALAGGVTAALILPGSANLIGGRGVTVEMRQARRIDDVRFPGAPSVLKMACGENPKRVYGRKAGPQTRMGEYAAFRAAFQAAADYAVKWKQYRARRAEWERRRARAAMLDAEVDKKAKASGKRLPHVKPEPAPDAPGRDARLEAIAGVLSGEVLAEVHCYTVRDMAQLLAISDQFGFDIRAFHHALEAYKIRDLLAARGVAIATWSDWWGFKLEAFDGIMENAALVSEAGGRVAIHSDSSIGIQRLNQEAAKAMWAGRNAGIDISDDTALRWVTANPAWILGIDKDTGTLEPGKRADVVVWSANPLSVYARAEVVLIAGRVAYERGKGNQPSDFELGNSALGAGSAGGVK